MYNISYKGTNCSGFGIIPERRPSVPAPEIRVTETEIPGRDGVLVETDGCFGTITIPVEFNYLVPPEKWMDAYRKAKRWLTGTGWLVLGDDQEYMYKVLYVKITDTERTSRRIGKLTAEFTCDPYSYLVSGQQSYSVDDVLYNPYMISHPIYRISGTGACTLTVNGNTMQATVNGNITIDTDRMISYNDQMVGQNTAVKGDYEDLYLQEGDNTISVSTGFSLSIIPNWREL